VEAHHPYSPSGEGTSLRDASGFLVEICSEIS